MDDLRSTRLAWTLGALVLMGWCSAGLQGADPAWTAVKARGGRYTFSMPAKPAEKIATQKSANGPVEVLEYSCISNGCLYKFEKSPVPVRLPEGSEEKSLDGVRDLVAKRTKLISVKRVAVDGHPGREFMIEAPLRPGAEPSAIAMRNYFVDGDFLQIRVFSLKPGTSPKDASKFFDSLKVVDVEQGVEKKPEPPAR